jgi:hypothetical protein
VPFDDEVRASVHGYAAGDLAGDLASHVEFFSFLDCDPGLRQRVGEEYYSARYIYKLFEGLRIHESWAVRAQVQLQVQQYASIYEACLHHLLFSHCADSPVVARLLRLPTLGDWSVSGDLRRRLAAAGAAAGRELVAAVRKEIKLEETKVRFDSKARAAAELGIIDAELADELIEFYTARNMIHIHAELRRGTDWEWEIDFARRAYWRLQLVCRQVLAWRTRAGTAFAEHPLS